MKHASENNVRAFSRAHHHKKNEYNKKRMEKQRGKSQYNIKYNKGKACFFILSNKCSLVIG